MKSTPQQLELARGVLRRWQNTDYPCYAGQIVRFAPALDLTTATRAAEDLVELGEATRHGSGWRLKPEAAEKSELEPAHQEIARRIATRIERSTEDLRERVIRVLEAAARNNIPARTSDVVERSGYDRRATEQAIYDLVRLGTVTIGPDSTLRLNVAPPHSGIDRADVVGRIPPRADPGPPIRLDMLEAAVDGAEAWPNEFERTPQHDPTCAAACAPGCSVAKWAPAPPPAPRTMAEILAAAKDAAFDVALRRHNGDRTAAARELDVARQTVHVWLEADPQRAARYPKGHRITRKAPPPASAPPAPRFAWSHRSPNCDNNCDCEEVARAHADKAPPPAPSRQPGCACGAYRAKDCNCGGMRDPRG